MQRTPSHKTPRLLGYRMPAEWEPHEAVWLAWPHDRETFPERLEKVEETYLEIIDLLHRSEQVRLCVKDEVMKARVMERLRGQGADLGSIDFHLQDYADVWFRDYGPIFLVRPSGNQLAMVHWDFNAWGRKYETHLKDTQIPVRIHEETGIPCFTPGMVLEGGSIDVNGEGALLTSEQCLLNPNRNPQLGREEIEEALREYLGVRRIIWLKQGIVGDDTDGHVDDLARFVGPRTVLSVYESDKTDPNYHILRENYEILRDSGDQDGNSLEVIKLPMPGTVSGPEGRLPASYANFYIGNQTVLVPAFGHANDRAACEVLESVFPDREVAAVRCEDLVHGLGALHCITQQEPAPGG